MIVPMYSEGASTVARTTGSKTFAILPPDGCREGTADPGVPLGKSLGLVTCSSAPDSMTTR